MPPRSIQVAAVLSQHHVIGEQIGDGDIPCQRDHVAIEVQLVRGPHVPVIGDPGLDVDRAEPDVEVVLLGIGAGGSKASRVAFRVGKELGRADFIDKTQQGPSAIAPGLLAQLGIQQVAGTLPDAVAARVRLTDRRIARTTVYDVAAAMRLGKDMCRYSRPPPRRRRDRRHARDRQPPPGLLAKWRAPGSQSAGQNSE
jgi:hypothetical protein